MNNEDKLHDAQQALKELEAKRTAIGIEARFLIADGIRKVIELYAANMDKVAALSFQSRFEDLSEPLLEYAENESGDLFSAEEKTLISEIRELEEIVTAEVRTHERNYTQPY